MNRFLKYAQVSNLMEIRQLAAQLFCADGQTDITKLIVAFRNFANTPQRLSGTSLMIFNLNMEEDIKEITSYRGADKSLARPGRKQSTASEGFEFHISY